MYLELRVLRASIREIAIYPERQETFNCTGIYVVSVRFVVDTAGLLTQQCANKICRNLFTQPISKVLCRNLDLTHLVHLRLRRKHGIDRREPSVQQKILTHRYPVLYLVLLYL